MGIYENAGEEEGSDPLKNPFSELGRSCITLANAMNEMAARINCQEDRTTSTTTDHEESDRHDRVSI